MPATTKETGTALGSLIRYLEFEYYSPVEHICQRAEDYITDLHGGDVDQTSSLYTTICKTLFESVRSYVRLRRIVLEQLAGAGNTDAGACYNAELGSLEADITRLLGELSAILEPSPEAARFPDLDRALRKEIKKLAERLREMFYLEHTALMPRLDEVHPAY